MEKKQPYSPKEKWDRLNNPTCVEDYGLSLSREELAQFPEGHAIINRVDELRRERKEMEIIMREMGKNCRKTIDNILKTQVGGWDETLPL